MALQVRSIQQGGGGDYTSLSGWIAGAPTLGSDIWKGEIDDNNEYNENTNLTASGTPSATSYLWLSGGASNRHAGVAGTGHPRVRGTTNGSHVFTMSIDFCRLSWLEIQQDSSGSSDEAVRILDGVDDFLISYCVIWSDTGVSDHDGIYMGTNNNVTGAIDNCIIYGFARAGIHVQQGSASPTVVLYIEHCAVYNNWASGEVESGGITVTHSSSSAAPTTTINLYNTWGARNDQAEGSCFIDMQNDRSTAPDGTVTWNGSHNCYDSGGITANDGGDNTTNWQSATNDETDTSQSSGAYIVVNDLTGGSEDLLPLDDEAGNLIIGNGTDRQGSESDSRQDFSVDITGGARPTTGVDIGPAQFAAAATDDPANLAAVVTDDDVALSWDASPSL